MSVFGLPWVSDCVADSTGRIVSKGPACLRLVQERCYSNYCEVWPLQRCVLNKWWASYFIDSTFRGALFV